MTTLDTQESLLTALYTRLTDDSTLKTAMGNEVRLFLTWAKPDATFPYLVHRIDMRAGGIWPLRMGTYLIDAWTNSPSASSMVAIRKRLIELLDEYQFNTTDVKNCKLSLETDGFIPETEPDIFHYTLQFSISLWRQAEAIYIITR